MSGSLFPGVLILVLTAIASTQRKKEIASTQRKKERNCINKIKNIVSLINIDLFLQFPL
jgi:hypothetical protein